VTVPEFARTVRASWVAVVAILLLGAGVGAGLAALQTPKYQSSAAVVIAAQAPADIAEANQGGTYTQQVAKSYAYVASTEVVLDRVIDRLGLDESAGSLAARVSATVPVDTQVISITASDPSPTQAARIANAVAAALADSTDLFTPSLTVRDNVVQVTTVQRAMPATSPVSPNVRLNIAIGAFIGLAAGLIFAVLRERRSAEGVDAEVADETPADREAEGAQPATRDDGTAAPVEKPDAVGPSSEPDAPELLQSRT
jgi:capsular polysaccharide biosynthesis protein